ncbi:MAG: MBOAT family protein [Bacteroidales bacterium]|nr:MBOAT family protein [Bacteroidales bacterium]
MNFSSSLFLLYFLPAFLLVYFLLGSRFRNVFTLGASAIFFFWGAPSFTFLLIVSILIDYYLSGAMHAASGKPRKTLLVFLLLLNLSMLLYFKYTGFFIVQFNMMMGWLGLPRMPLLNVILPLGISFITFQKMSYLIDVYRGTTQPAEKLRDYALFIFFFPKLLAGPIVRYKEFAPRIAERKEFSGFEERLTGFFRFSLGLAKKVMIANVLGGYADEIFATETFLLNTKTAWLGAIAYSFQIYFDFSAYSDMAIGLARMIGFNIKENFNNPYISVGITEFWKRWHITLGTWLRDYLFLPVAYALSRRMPENKYLGLKTDKWLYIFASLITMLLCGFWHGAGWTFILWGLYHGVFMSVERLFLTKLMKKAGRVIAVFFTFFVVTLGWVIFRADSLTHAVEIYSLMFSLNFQVVDFLITPQLIVLLIVSTVFSFWALAPGIEKWQMKIYTGIRTTNGLIAITVSAFILFIMGLSQVTASGFNPFIYFRF